MKHLSENTNRQHRGRGAQLNPQNRFSAKHVVQEHVEGIDDYSLGSNETKVYRESPKRIVNKVDSPDLSFNFSVNPYQGCEHGCAYCYARNSHEYWGFSAGIDFEKHIIYKPDAARLVEKAMLSKNWRPEPIMLSGNTDCYQPLEKKFKLTRQILEVLDRYQNPVGIITKNRLILRDLDILKRMSDHNLVRVNISITTLDEKLKNKLEPRTSSIVNRFKTIEVLSKSNIPVGLMLAPVIPGINNYEIPDILKAGAEAGAIDANMTMIRLNGAIPKIFEQWLENNMPERKQKIWHQIAAVHAGKVNDSVWGRRMTGSGPVAEAIRSLFKKQKQIHFSSQGFPPYDTSRFRKNGNLNLF